MGAPAARRDSAERVAPVLWIALAVGAALVAGILAGTFAAGDLTLAATAFRGSTDAAAVAAVGLGLVTVLVPTSARDSRGTTVIRRGDRATVVVAAGWLIATLVSLAVRTAEAYGRPLGSIGAAEVGTFATRIAAGRGVVLTALCAIAVLGCAIARLRNPDAVPGRIVLVAALLGALTPAVTGHTGSSPDHQLAVVTVALHVGASALWVGGLGVLLVLIAPQRALLDRALPRFSRIATVCVFGTALTGVANAALRLPTLPALVTSGYGVLILVKTALVAILGGLGWLARRRLQRGTLPVLRWAGIEVTVMALTIGVAAALSQTAP
ncbi:CopD family protein [Pseudonocardia ailaonensis]|uniref:CopD family protein n=1 Tax=Pseudonocardia ailaonensis TaxID=367279 RepID=A0ABN2NK91_9PSEU